MAEPTQKEPRGPTNLRIKFRSASLDQFIERYAVDVSRGGIFIRTREPLPVGTRLRLDFQLLDAAPLLAGEGTVVWIRENDPARGNVTPGMGVRFDKLSPDSQPTLERILAEKARLQQAGIATGGIAKSGGKSGGGMAVRRATGAVAALDPASAPSSPARAGVSPAGVSSAGGPVAGGPPAGGVRGDSPPASAPRHTAPMASVSTSEPAPPSIAARPSQVPSISKTSFFASPAGPSPAASAGTGAPTRLRNTTGSSAVRPAPVPTALFEPPTADDIDKALEALQEEPAPGAASLEPAPTTGADAHVAQPSPGTPTAPARAPGTHAAPPLSEPLRFPTQDPSEDAFNDPTRVVDVVDELVGGAAARSPEVPGSSEAGSSEPSAGAPSAAGLDEPVGAQGDDAKSTSPAPPALRGRPVREAGRIERMVAPEKSRRFRAASSAYPTLQRRRISLSLAVVVIGGTLILGVLKLHWKERLFPAAPSPAPVAETPASTTPAPSSTAAPAAIPGAPAPSSAAVPPAVPAVPPPSSAAAPAAATTAAPGVPAPSSTSTAVPAPPATPSGPAAPAIPTPSPTGMTAAAGAAPGNAPAVAKTKPPGQEKPTPAVSATPTASKDGLTEAEHHAKHGLHHRAPQTAEATPEAKPQAEGPTAATAGAERSAADAKTGTDKPSARAAGEKAAGEKAADDNAGGEAFAAASAPGAPAATTPEPASPTLRVTSSPAGAEVIIDGTSLGYTPFSTKALDPGSPHAITVKKTGYESTDRMISGLDWSRPHGNSPQSLKLNVKLRRAAASPPETPAPPKDNAGPADDSGGPYIKEIKPDKP